MPLKANPTVVERFWMVWDDRGHAPIRKYSTEQEAITEADRLAHLHEGKAFHVLEHIGFAQKIIPSSFTYVSE